MTARFGCRVLAATVGALCVWLAAYPAAHARDFAVHGRTVQGGLMIGATDPGTRITLDGKPVRVGTDGRFAFGFGRDAPAKATLEAVFPDGSRTVRHFDVAQRKYRISRLNGLPPKMVSPSAEQMKRIRREAEEIHEARAVFSEREAFAGKFVWPARGRISGVYGSQRILNGKPRAPHLGLDIAAPVGTPVVAAAAGKVTLAEKDLYFTGGTIAVDHGHGISTIYSHLSAVEVKVGQTVRQGQRIGRIGATGRVTGPHLDWRINWFQERLDPRLIVGPMPGKKKKK